MRSSSALPASLLLLLFSTPAFAAEAAFPGLDQFFSEWLVGPLASVLFFDIWPGEEVSFPIVVMWLVLGATFFTGRMAFINLRGFKHAVVVTTGAYDNPEETGEISHFQALSAALSATVGLGNIAGVAVAVGLGGPGAVF